MDRIRKLKDLISQLNNSKNVPDSYKYIGTGNPMAQILIVGKECAIDPDNIPQVDREVNNNFSDWSDLIEKSEDLQKHNVPNWNELDNYSPLHAYKGSSYKNTSRTWKEYQKLVNLVFNLEESETLNFQEYVFITEANSSPNPTTNDANKDSLSFRKGKILNSDFFRDFPVVLIAGQGYFNISNQGNEIEEVFDVNFKNKVTIPDFKNQNYYIHRGRQDPKRLLINTRQLSMNVSTALLKTLASEIKQNLNR